jgi:hypothetical protein
MNPKTMTKYASTREETRPSRKRNSQEDTMHGRKLEQLLHQATPINIPTLTTLLPTITPPTFAPTAHPTPTFPPTQAVTNNAAADPTTHPSAS